MGKKSVKINKGKIAVTGAMIGAALTGSLFLTSNKQNIKIPSYEVLKVVDGDTFITKEKQYIRVASIDAPELNDCGGKEAKIALEKLVLGKPVYFKVLYRDGFNRLIAQVYTSNIDVSEKMIKEGFAYYLSQDNVENRSFYIKTNEKAKAEGIGIFSKKCTQIENAKNPHCIIKGNIHTFGKVYFTPDCGNYERVIVQLFKGERWFCSEKEAKDAGFRKTEIC